MFSKIFVLAAVLMTALLPSVQASYDVFLNQTQNFVMAAPSGANGTMYPRLLVAGDIPALPYASSTLASADIYVGNGSNVATAVAASGDLTLANTGAFTLATVNGSPGTYSYATLTVNGKGLVTAASNGTPPIAPAVKNKTATYTAVANDVVLMDATTASDVVNLPACGSNGNAVIWVKKVDSTAHTVTITANGSDTIDGQATQVLDGQWQDAEMICDSANTRWAVL
jgi:hypothetical protein